MKAMNSKKGFTLIELLIVIAIIGVLAVAFLPSLLGAPAKGRDTSRIADLQKIQKVLINGNLEGTAYPVASSCVDTAAPWNTTYLPAFGGKVPIDPNLAPWSVFPKGTVALAAACNARYAYLAKPTAAYAFGLYAKMETIAAGNAKCSELEAANGGATINKPVDAADSCYAILTQ